jgi:hypothetical protein
MQEGLKQQDAMTRCNMMMQQPTKHSGHNERQRHNAMTRGDKMQLQVMTTWQEVNETRSIDEMQCNLTWQCNGT